MMRHVGVLVAGGVSLSLVGGCAWRWDWPRHRVVIQVEAAATRQLALTDTRGQPVVLDAAQVVISSVRLVPCEDDAPVGYVWWRRLALVSEAHAHGLSTPTLLAIPAIVTSVGDAAALTVGELEPPPESYCEALITLSAADDDARGAGADALIGVSARVVGARAGRALVMTSALRAEARRALDPPLVLPRDVDVAVTLSVRPSLDAAALARLDFAALEEPDQERALWAALLSGLTISLTQGVAQ